MKPSEPYVPLLRKYKSENSVENSVLVAPNTEDSGYTVSIQMCIICSHIEGCLVLGPKKKSESRKLFYLEIWNYNKIEKLKG